MGNSHLCGLAANPALPRQLLDALVAEADDHTRYLLACRDDLSAEHVRVLVDRGSEFVEEIVAVLLRRGLLDPAAVPTDNPWLALVVAQHAGADPSVARELAANPEAAVRRALAERVDHLPADVVDQLAHDPDLFVVVAVAMNQPLPERLASELSRHPADEVRAGLVKNPSAPEDFLAGLVDHPDKDIRLTLATRAGLPGWAYERLAKDPDVQQAVAANPAASESALRSLAAGADHQLGHLLVHNPATPLDLLVDLAATARIGPTRVPRVDTATDAELRVMAGSPTMQVRMLAAERADLPADLVDLFVADPDVGVVKGIITNPALAPEQVRALVTKHGQRLYPRAARNPNCPSDLLHHMALNGRLVEQVYQEAAQNPNTTGETLLLCLHDRRARTHAARHPNLPTETIVELLDDWTVAEAAAANPSLPEAVMAELLGV